MQVCERAQCMLPAVEYRTDLCAW